MAVEPSPVLTVDSQAAMGPYRLEADPQTVIIDAIYFKTRRTPSSIGGKGISGA